MRQNETNKSDVTFLVWNIILHKRFKDESCTVVRIQAKNVSSTGCLLKKYLLIWRVAEDCKV